MALSLVLGRGTPPANIDIRVACTLDDVPEGFRIPTMDPEVRGRVPDLDAKGFQDAEQAHRVCPVSHALEGDVAVGVNTTLAD